MSSPTYKKDLLKEYVYNELLRGTTQSELVEKIQNDFWNIGKTYSTGSAKNLITQVRKEIKSDWEEERKDVRDTLLARLMSLYSDSIDAKDRYGALNCLKEIAKITGLYEPQKLDVNANVNGGLVIDFNFD